MTSCFEWNRAAPGVHHSISLTGGEPLVQADVLAGWLPALRGAAANLIWKPTAPCRRPLSRCCRTSTGLPWISSSPSVTGGRAPWAAHREFLRPGPAKGVPGQGGDRGGDPREEVEAAARLVHEGRPGGGARSAAGNPGRPDRSHRPSGSSTCRARPPAIHPLVRMIPQTHRFIGLL